MDNLSTLLGGRFSRVLSRVMTEKALDVVLETSGVALGSDWRVAAQSAVPVVLLDKVDLEFVSPGPFEDVGQGMGCLLYTSPSPRDLSTSRMPSSA